MDKQLTRRIFGGFLGASLLAQIRRPIPSPAPAFTYYVDSVGGSDSNNGHSPAMAWKTLAKANGTAFVAGQSLGLKRGRTWNETLGLTPFGTTAQPIVVGAYGRGAPPKITGEFVCDSAAQWTNESADIWYVTLSSGTSLNAKYCRLGGIAAVVQSAKANLTAPYQFWWDSVSQRVYVYCTDNPATVYGTVRPVAISNGIYSPGGNNITFEDLWVTRVYANCFVAGGTGLVVQRCRLDGNIPNQSVNGCANGPGTSAAYIGCDILRCSSGVTCPAGTSAVLVSGCNIFACQAGALYGAGLSALTLRDSHLYANGVGWGGAYSLAGDSLVGIFDQGPAIDGGRNLYSTTPPTDNRGLGRYPPIISMSNDDVGRRAASVSYVDAIRALFEARGMALTINLTPGEGYATSTDLAAWSAAGHDLEGHSWSHAVYAGTGMMIQYVGSGSACALTILGNVLSTSCTGAPGDTFSLDLTAAPYINNGLLIAYINGLTGKYTCVFPAGSAGDPITHSICFADVAAQDIKTAAYGCLWDLTRLTNDETTSCLNWIAANAPGGWIPRAYAWPTNAATATVQALTRANGWLSGRGSGVSPFQSTLETSLYDMVATNSVSCPPHGTALATSFAYIQCLMFQSAAWGRIAGLFFHSFDDLTTTPGGEIDNMLAAIQTVPGSYMTCGQVQQCLAGLTRTRTDYYGMAAP